MESRELRDEQWQPALSPASSESPHRPPQGRRPEDPGRHPLRPDHGLPLDGHAQAVTAPIRRPGGGSWSWATRQGG